jgi:lipopolysaccharide/colanic/teichoic acid biosynthesis glycosyltransferase
MYKFRTLVPDADERLADIPTGQRHDLETRLGRFLRDTRLDELPQLFNIPRGDMTYARILPREF